MKQFFNIVLIKIIFFIYIFSYSVSFSDNHNIYDTLEQLQKDIKTLEKQFIQVQLI